MVVYGPMGKGPTYDIKDPTYDIKDSMSSMACAAKLASSAMLVAYLVLHCIRYDITSTNNNDSGKSPRCWTSRVEKVYSFCFVGRQQEDIVCMHHMLSSMSEQGRWWRH